MPGLDLSGNQLTGTIPTAWGSPAPKFQMLNLAGNFLSGPLPTTAAMTYMLLNSSYVDLSGNQFTGALPATWGPTPASLQPNNTGMRWVKMWGEPCGDVGLDACLAWEPYQRSHFGRPRASRGPQHMGLVSD